MANTDQPDPKWIEAARRAFGHWIEKRYQCANWWFNRINTPGQMAEILFDLRPHLGAAEFEAGLEVVRQVTLDPHGLTAFGQQFHDWSTGANAMWVIERAIALGCLTDDPDLVTRAQLQLGRICHTSEGEGIKPDHSFHQHGARFYAGGYGAGYTRMAAKMAALLDGTPWALAQPRVATLSRFLLDGQQWLVCADRRNPSSGGRNIARKGDAAPGTGRAMIEPARSLIEADPVNGAELREMLDRFLTDGSTANPLVGNRCFWCSDVMVHRRPDFVASIRAVSQRTQSMETCNSENLRGVHLADGLVLQWRTGAEYDGIFPAWDWEKLPGVTCTHGKDNLVPKSIFGPTRFVGGASDGEFGLFAYDLRAVHEPRSLRGRKAWFCFDNGMAWLGAGIDCEDALPVLTTIDQRRLEDEVRAGPPDGLRAIDPGEHRIAGDRWLWHDRVAYAALDGRARMLQLGEQAGDWHAINPGRYRRPEPVSLPVFTRWIDHGVAPTDDNYAELVAFNVSTEEVDRLAEAPPVRLLRNTAELQAVAHERLDLTMAAFYAPGQLVLPDGRTLRVREPGLVMVRGGEIVAPADPTHRPNQSPAPADQQVAIH